ncbi:MAG: BMC domain-containing protein [Acidobacteria bacterium]|nr:MAG: BMC domain-containing protein [Acidobacteriota bacterium]
MEPAIGLLELASIAAGIRAGDAMVKRAPIDVIFAGTVHPGKYLVLVGGAVASVEEAMVAGEESAGACLDRLFLPDAHRDVVAALRGGRATGSPGEAIGIVETRTVASIVGAADRGVKGAAVTLRDLHLADELGGKAYCLFQGPLADVEAAVEIAVGGLARPELLVEQVIIPQIHGEMLSNLDAAPTFLRRVRSERGR